MPHQQRLGRVVDQIIYKGFRWKRCALQPGRTRRVWRHAQRGGVNDQGTVIAGAQEVERSPIINFSLSRGLDVLRERISLLTTAGNNPAGTLNTGYNGTACSLDATRALGLTPSAGDVPIRSAPYEYGQTNAVASADFRVTRSSSVEAGVERENFRRTYRERENTWENKFRLAYVNRDFSAGTLPSGTRAISIAVESNLNVPVELALIDPSGRVVQTAKSSSGLVILEAPITQGGVYVIKTVNVSLGPIQIWSLTTPWIAK